MKIFLSGTYTPTGRMPSKDLHTTRRSCNFSAGSACAHVDCVQCCQLDECNTNQNSTRAKGAWKLFVLARIEISSFYVSST